MKKALSFLFLFILFSGCKNPFGEPEVFSENFCVGATSPSLNSDCSSTGEAYYWNFENSSNYSFDSNYVELDNGKATLKKFTLKHSGDEFSNGDSQGLSVVDSKLKLNASGSTLATHVNQILPDKETDLLGYWRLDGDYSDSSTNSNSGTVKGDTELSSIKKLGSHSAVFDGNGDELSLGDLNILDGKSKFSYTVWVYHTSTNSDDDIFLIGEHDSSNPFVFWRDEYSIDSYSFLINDSDGDYSGVLKTSFVPVLKQWTHIAFVFDGANAVKIYINGVEDANSPFSIPSIDNIKSGSFNFKVSNDASPSFKGNIDEFSIWDGLLSDSEVLKLFESQSISYSELSSSWTPHWDKVVAYWKMNGSWYDSSLNSYHGTTQFGASFTGQAKNNIGAGVFDGVDAYVSTGYYPSASDKTVMYWVKYSSLAERPIVGSIDGGDRRLYLGLDSDGSIYAGSGSNYINSGRDPAASNVSLNDWVHLAMTRSNGTAKVYVNAKLVTDFSYSVSGTSTQDFYIGALNNQGSRQFNNKASLDEMAIWDFKLTQDEIYEIYRRQKNTYSGSYTSPIVNLGKAISWDKVEVSTDIAFGKELISTGPDDNVGYPLQTADFSNGLTRYLTMDGKGSLANGVSIPTKLGSSPIASNANGTGFKYTDGLVGQAIELDGVDDYIDFGSYTPTEKFYTISLWYYPLSTVGNQTVFHRGSSSGCVYNPKITWSGVDSKLSVAESGCSNSGRILYQAFEADRWQHLVVTRNDNVAKVYINGELLKTDTSQPNRYSNISKFLIGAGRVDGSSVSGHFKGKVDEFGKWTRALSDSEVLELYRRVGNNLNFQVRSCIDESCNCKSFNDSPQGTAADCDGDGVVNASDSDDEYKAVFIGPGGSGSSFYNERFNRTAANMDFNCSLNSSDSDANICMSDEITLSGEVKSTASSYNYSDMSSSAAPEDNPYFQYRVFFGAEENSSCSGDICVPELKSFLFGEQDRYLAGDANIVTNNSIDYTNIQSIDFEVSGSCDFSYQLSPDGVQYYYFDGTNWVAALSQSEGNSNPGALVKEKISKFASDVGAGSLQLKIYFNSNTLNNCSISKISVVAN